MMGPFEDLRIDALIVQCTASGASATVGKIRREKKSERLRVTSRMIRIDESLELYDDGGMIR
jgi:hypothetical protein